MDRSSDWGWAILNPTARQPSRLAIGVESSVNFANGCVKIIGIGQHRPDDKCGCLVWTARRINVLRLGVACERLTQLDRLHRNWAIIQNGLAAVLSDGGGGISEPQAATT